MRQVRTSVAAQLQQLVQESTAFEARIRRAGDNFEVLRSAREVNLLTNIYLSALPVSLHIFRCI